MKHKGKETKEIKNNQKTKGQMVTASPHIQTITLNVYGLNSPIKRYKVAKQTSICCPRVTHLCCKANIGSSEGVKDNTKQIVSREKSVQPYLLDKMDIKTKKVAKVNIL